MEHFEFGWQTADGLQLYAQGWSPEAGPRALVCLVHGIGEHSGRYAHVAATLCEAGYALIGFDQRGHGRSEGPRGHTPSLDMWLDDVGRLIDEAGQRYPGKPRFLYGHSLGGNTVLNYALRRRPKLSGVIATGPWLRLSAPPPGYKVLLARAMNRVAPAFSQPSGLDTRSLSHDPVVVRAYETDPFVHEKVSARLYLCFYEAGLWALEHAGEFPLPLLLMHGGADAITSAAASQEFAEHVPAGRCTFRAWEGFYHEIHNEPQQPEVLAVMTGWLDEQMARRPQVAAGKRRNGHGHDNSPARATVGRHKQRSRR